MKLIIKAGSTSYRALIFIADSSSTTGAGLAGLVFNSAGLVWYYARQNDGNTGGTSVTLATATLGTFASGGFKEKDATNMPGWYEIGIPDAVLATTGSAQWATMHLKGATNMAPLPIEIQLVTVDLQDTVRAGLTALPNATAGANTGLPVVGTQVPNATAGATNGLFIAGTNAATTVTTSFTTTFTGNLTGSVASVTGAVGSVTGAVGSVTGAVGSVTGAIGSVGAGGITAASFGASAIDAAALATDAAQEIRDAVFARAFSAAYGSYTFDELTKMMAAVLLAKASGLATTTATYRNIADSADVIVATVDVDGNRTAVTRTP